MHVIINRKDWPSGPCLSDTEFRLAKGGRYGVVGPNGSGKSTLLAIMAGLDTDFEGRVSVEPGTTVALVAQEAGFDPGLSTIDWLTLRARAREAAVRALEDELAACTDGDRLPALLARYETALEAWEAEGGADAEDQALRLLERLGLEDRAFNPAGTLSGGEQGRLRLAAALDKRPGILLLDEPTNHLDLWQLARLDEALDGFRGTLVVASHDRRLLTTRCDQLLVTEAGRVSLFGGGFAEWRLERVRAAAAQGMAWQADRQRVARLEDIVRRYRDFARRTADPAWGKRLRAGESHLERAKAAATEKPDTADRRPGVRFGDGRVNADIAVDCAGHRVERGGMVLIDRVGFRMACGERVALVGPNGSGKSSLLADLTRLASWDHPALRIGPSLKLAVVSQNRAGFDPEQTLAAHFLDLSPCRREDVIAFLKPWRFPASDLDTRLGRLSGGQWQLFQLARALRTGANFLVLDEPTNHLDLDAREALEEALAAWDGTILAVSHDRWFLEAVCDRVLSLETGRLVDAGVSVADFLETIGGRGRPAGCAEEQAAAEALRRQDFAEARRLGRKLAKSADQRGI